MVAVPVIANVDAVTEPVAVIVVAVAEPGAVYPEAARAHRQRADV